MDVTSSVQEKVLINSSSVEIGVYIFAPTKPIKLTHDFITLPLDRGTETLQLSLSFKHINKVEFLDNKSGEGAAGLVLFVNDFMAKKIQDCIDQGGTGFADFVLKSYANNSNKIILLDIQNKDPTFFDHVHEILDAANLFHRNYVVQQMNKTRKKRIYFHFPVNFLETIGSSQWKTLTTMLSNARLDFKQRKRINDNNNENDTDSPQMPLPTYSGSSNSHQLLPTECHQPVEIGQIHLQQSKVQLPAYTVMTMPLHLQTTALVTIEAAHNQPSSTELSFSTPQHSSTPLMMNAKAPDNPSPPAILAFPTPRPNNKPSAVESVNSSKPSPTLVISQQFTQSFMRQEPVDMLFQLDQEHHQLYDQQPKQNPTKTTTVGEPTVAQYLSLELPSANKFLPRSLKVPKLQPNNGDIQSRSAPPLLSAQPTPCTSREQQMQLSPKLQNRVVPRVGTGAAKVGNKREREVHLIDDEENELETKLPDKRSNDTLFSFPPTGRDSCSVHYADLKYLSRNFMLNDTIIDFYLKYIHHCLVPQERRPKIFIFNSFFFGRLTQPPPGGKPSSTVTPATKIRRVSSNFQKVKNWTKKVNLFNMDYIVIPINEDIHWLYLRLGICCLNTNEPIFAEPAISKTFSPMPHLIVLNSLIDPAEDKHLAVRDQLGEYLQLEYSDKHCQDTKTFFNKQMMEVVVPTLLPQQKNFIDCGLFLLHFAQLFLSNPPKVISKHSSFHRWYPDFEIKHKRDELRSVIKQLASHVKASDFVQLPTPKPKSKIIGRRSQADKMQMILDGMALMGRTRRYSDSELDGIMKDKHFSCLYRPRSLDSLVYENREKPVVLQPPTIAEMSRFKQPRRVRQEIFASQRR